MTDAEDLRAQLEASTDPPWIERMAKEAERAGYSALCAMPGRGPWVTRSFGSDLFVSSPEHGVWRLQVLIDGNLLRGRWVKVEAPS